MEKYLERNSSIIIKSLVKKFFRDAFTKMKLGITSEDIDEMLKYVDKSGDGKLNYQEFLKALKL